MTIDEVLLINYEIEIYRSIAEELKGESLAFSFIKSLVCILSLTQHLKINEKAQILSKLSILSNYCTQQIRNTSI